MREAASGSAIKRGLDIVAAGIALIVLSPLVAIFALMALIAQGPPAFFKQDRVGRGGKMFALVKLRTMTNLRNSSGSLLPDDERLTATGRFFRRFRIDELPSFVCVLTGKMSLVGPRPLPPYVLETMAGSGERHLVRPGFTGLAQVCGNTLLTNEEKLALDLFYVRRWSLAKDMHILLKTVPTIILGETRDETLIKLAMMEREPRASTPHRRDSQP